MAEVNHEEPVSAISGFVQPEKILNTERFTELTLVPSRGYSLLVRAKRHGRWWMLKGLKESYRNDTVYQLLLKKEFEITSQLQHPMIVSAFSLEEVEGLGTCIVMEWIDGLTLREWLSQANPTGKQRRHVADMLMEAVSYVHSRQTQHRDLKPSNIMLTHYGQCLKLIDFGLSDTSSHAILKASAGTEGYMAPDGPSDIYSLGCILHELRLGLLTEMVARRCRAPQNLRYRDISAVQRVLHRCWYWPGRIAAAICLICLIIGIYFIGLSRTQAHHQAEMQVLNDSLQHINLQNRTNTENLLATQFMIDSLQSQLKQMDGNEKVVAAVPTHPAIDSLQSRLKHFEDKERAELAAIKAREEYIRAEKRKIDSKLGPLSVKHHKILDTLSYQTYYDMQYPIEMQFNRICGKTWSQYDMIKDQELVEYIIERYNNPWVERFIKIPESPPRSRTIGKSQP